MGQVLSSVSAGAVFLLGILFITACSPGAGAPSGGSPSTRGNPTASHYTIGDRNGLLAPLFMQCLADHNIQVGDEYGRKVNVSSQGAKDGWLINGKVVENSAFYAWFMDHGGMYPINPSLEPNKSIDLWVQEAADNSSAWPTKVCGLLPKDLR